jgi:hypothetical protein
MASFALRFAAPLCALSFAACSGTAVVEQGTGGAGGGASSSTGTSVVSSSSATSTSSGTGPCTSHEQCPGGVCVFLTGQCAPACDLGFCMSCGPGSRCDGCGTSSCPDCLDCVGACLPSLEGRCDDDDPCPPGEECLFFNGFEGSCNPSCAPDVGCPPNYLCDPCGTASCCGCENCVSVCIGQ